MIYHNSGDTQYSYTWQQRFSCHLSFDYLFRALLSVVFLWVFFLSMSNIYILILQCNDSFKMYIFIVFVVFYKLQPSIYKTLFFQKIHIKHNDQVHIVQRKDHPENGKCQEFTSTCSDLIRSQKSVHKKLVEGSKSFLCPKFILRLKKKNFHAALLNR